MTRWSTDRRARSTFAVVNSLGHNTLWPKENRKGGGRMYAIAFDLDQDALKTHYPNVSHNRAYEDIRKVLEGFGFRWQQGSVYFGNDTVTPVTCVMAVQAVQREHPWFG